MKKPSCKSLLKRIPSSPTHQNPSNHFHQICDLNSRRDVYGLFSQTLGNPQPSARRRVLENIESLLPKGAIFITGVALIPKDEQTIQRSLDGYRAPNYQNLIMGPLKLLGLDQFGRFQVRWNRAANDVEGVFVFHTPVEIENKNKFKKGDELLVFRSHRFTEQEIITLWQSAGLGMPTLHKSPTFPYVLVVAQVP